LLSLLLIVSALTLMVLATTDHQPYNTQFEGFWTTADGRSTVAFCRRGGRLYGSYDQVGIFVGRWYDDGTAEGEFFEGGAGLPDSTCYTGNVRIQQVNDFSSLIVSVACKETPDTWSDTTYNLASQTRPLYYQCAALAGENPDDDDNVYSGHYVASNVDLNICLFDNGADADTDLYFYSSYVSTGLNPADIFTVAAQGLAFRSGTITSGVYRQVGLTNTDPQLDFVLEDGSLMEYFRLSGAQITTSYRYISADLVNPCDAYRDQVASFPALNGAATMTVALSALLVVLLML